MLSWVEFEQRWTVRIDHDSRPGDRALRQEDEAAGSANDLQTTSAVDRVSKRLDQAETEAQTVLDTRFTEGALRSLVGRDDLQLTTHVPTRSGVRKRSSTADRYAIRRAVPLVAEPLPTPSSVRLPGYRWFLPVAGEKAFLHAFVV